MSPEIYNIFAVLVVVAIVGVGLCSMLLLVGLIGFIILRDIRIPGPIKHHPWDEIAEENNLSFVSKSGILGHYLENRDTLVGEYRGYYLTLQFTPAQYFSSYTSLAVSANGIMSNHIISDDELAVMRPITADEITNFLIPNGLPDDLKGSIKAFYDDRKIYYQQTGHETNLDYLRRLFDLVCDIADAYPQIVLLGGEAVPALKYIAAHNHRLKSLAISLIESIGQETQERLGSRAATLLCPNCLVRCAEHKVPRSLWQKITYYGCRSCGQSIEFLNHSGPIVARLDFTSAMTQIEQNGKLYINRFSHDGLFDFDQVQITHVTDEDVERFAVQVGNDTDPVRKPRYNQMTCTIAPDCHLSENTMRILRNTFGKVEVKVQPQ